jgi:hypothetical protein
MSPLAVFIIFVILVALVGAWLVLRCHVAAQARREATK